jgi:glycosyltransferase involved in cell wall biosynthesis
MAVCGTSVAKLMRKPHVITMHGNQFMTRRLRRRMALRWAFRNSRAAVAVSEATRRDLASTLGLAPARIHLVRNGVAVRKGDPGPVREEFELSPPGTLLLLGVGNLVERKGYHVLLEALGLLRAGGCHVPWRLVIAGEGSERVRLEEMARRIGIHDRVFLPGRRDDIADLQAAADVFVMPSLWEGLPLAVLEAMFGGSAVVATRTHGIPEAIDNEETGLIVPPGDAAALAEALRRVLTDPSLRHALAGAARERALREFTITHMVDAYEALYWSAR